MENTGAQAFRLPPLILHPFSSPEDNTVLLESSKANLALQGLVPAENASHDELDRMMSRGR